MVSPTEIQIRSAARDDAATLLALIGELADYERLRHEVVADATLLERHLFGERRVAEAVLAERAGEAVGYALFFPTFSTFLGRPGIWLEDLFVRPAERGTGIGRMLFAHVASLAVARDCGRLEWSALDWNEPALAFYRGLGAHRLEEWQMHRLDGEALMTIGRASA